MTSETGEDDQPDGQHDRNDEGQDQLALAPRLVSAAFTTAKSLPPDRWPSRSSTAGILRRPPWKTDDQRRGEDVAVIGFIVFGLVVGVLARLLVPGRQELSLGMTVLLGVVGSVVGGVVANALGTGDVLELNFLGSVVAIAASVVLIVIGERTGVLRRRLRRSR